MFRIPTAASFRVRSNSRRRTTASRRPTFEPLEARHVLTTFTVTSLADFPVSGPDNAPGTLRQAIYDANQASDADVIQFATSLSGAINLTTADEAFWGWSALVISSPITIQGNANGITIGRAASAGEWRLLHVTMNGSLTLESISLTGGVTRGLAATTPGEAGGEARGGAIYNEGALQILASTLYGNEAIGGNAFGSGAGGRARGGAIFNDQGTVTLRNVTLSGNAVHSGAGTTVSGFGGGVYSLSGHVTILNSTLTENVATSGRGLYVLAEQDSTVEITSSIIGQHEVPTSGWDLTIPPDAGGHVQVTGSNNLIRWQNDYSFITVSTADPLLGALANNGGPTMTHALAPISPALNLGSNPAGLTSDQRGAAFSRTAGAAPDIGAYEVQTASSAALPGDYNGNHAVDAADYVLWRKTLGTAVEAFTGADGDGDGSVAAADHEVWRGNFGVTSAGAGAAVEASSASFPASALLDIATPFASIAGDQSTVTAFEFDAMPSRFPISHLSKSLLLERSASHAVSEGAEVPLIAVPHQQLLFGDKIASSERPFAGDNDVDCRSFLACARTLDAAFAEWPAVA